MLSIFRLAFSHNRQSYSTTVVELWAQCQTVGIALPQDKPVAASAFCNTRKKLDEHLFKALNQRIIAVNEENKQAHRWRGRRLFAVDGMKINLPCPLRHSGYAVPSDKYAIPKGW